MDHRGDGASSRLIERREVVRSGRRSAAVTHPANTRCRRSGGDPGSRTRESSDWWGHSVVRVKDGDVHGHSVAAAEASGQQAACAPSHQGRLGEVAELGGIGGDEAQQGLCGDFRIVYRIDDDYVTILAIDHRADIYRPR